MALVQTVEVLATPILPPGYRMLNGRVVGPTDETHPPGSGGPMPVQRMAYSKVRITTIRDTHSGHTTVKTEHYTQLADGSYSTTPGSLEAVAEMERKALARAEGSPGRRFMVGQPVMVTQATADALNAPKTMEPISEKAPAPETAGAEDPAKTDPAPGKKAK